MKVYFDPVGRRTPPLFYAPLTESELERVCRQMAGHRFDPSVVLGGAAPCPLGGFRVLVCAPLSRAGGVLKPFPTTFWLTCPHLNRRVGTVESAGGVSALEAWLTERVPEAWLRYSHLHALLRLGLLGVRGLKALRASCPPMLEALARGGVGGVRGGGSVRVKCLHLQVASWLALGHHPGAEWLQEQGLGNPCDGRIGCALRAPRTKYGISPQIHGQSF
ncbi:hypothetical protein FF3_01190 [Fretibacterium fastidiosum]